ncbi:non-ribosomal peptide synthetase [Nocardia gipuzkoensis]|uniref:non-ribosomal peptide synthetase n=1 Tax=Nocardia gipuzkoensis TaxID=2749991 RepID=UPI0024580942|nr:non-ribosomal peptide synthetase [Nocardia gipuzkoensis]
MHHLTYHQLHTTTNHLANTLTTHNIKPDTIIGICSGRSLDFLVAAIAVLKAGGAFLPLDPNSPSERLRLILADAAPVAVIGDLGGIAFDGPVIQHAAGLSRDDAPVLAGEMRGGNLAYVLYTSGSTGKPKAVMSTHAGLVNRILWMQREYGLDCTDTVLHKTPTTFDVSVWEMFWPLISGARLVIMPENEHRSPAALARIMASESVTTAHFVPAMLRAFAEEPSAAECVSLRQIMASGEALTSAAAHRLGDRLPQTTLHNLYGPTEASIDVTAHRWDRDTEVGRPTVPIGRPISNIRVYILDERLRLVPPGVPGELYIAGVGLARGYLRQPGLTSQRFVSDPFSDRPGDRLYRTGDRCRYLTDGAIEYLDRTDRQLKIRGYRIEPGEIEAALEEHRDIAEAAVVACDRRDGRPARLIAYVRPAPERTPHPDHVLARLRSRLPAHVIPAAVIVLAELPLTSSGKLDRRALPDPDPHLVDAEGSRPPRTDSERTLAAIWTTVLGIDGIGVDDNFFAIGGDSIRSLEVIARARAHGIALDLPTLFEHQTIAGLLRSTTRGDTAVSEVPAGDCGVFGMLDLDDRRQLPADVVDAYPLSSMQLGMVFDAEFARTSSVYHDVFSYRVNGPFDSSALKSSLSTLVQRHPVLRTSIDLQNYSTPLQLVHRSGRIPLTITDLRGLPSKERHDRIVTWQNSEITRGFELHEPSMFRFQVHRCDDTSFELTFSCSNVILDGWSVAVLLTELFTAYSDVLAGRTGDDTDVDTSFRRYVQLEKAAVDSIDQHDYWQRALDAMSLAQLPRWATLPHARVGGDSHPRRVHAVHTVEIDDVLGQSLTELAVLARTPLKSVLLAAHMFVIDAFTGQPRTATGVVVNGRPEEAGAAGVLGLFLNVVPLASDSVQPTWIARVRAVFEAEQALTPHRRYPVSRMRTTDGHVPKLDSAFNFVQFHVYRSVPDTDQLHIVGTSMFDDTNFTLWTEFSVHPINGRLSLNVTYDAAQLAAEQVKAMGQLYSRVLAAIAADPHGAPASMTAVEPATLAKWNDTSVPLDTLGGIPSLFETIARTRPSVVAFHHGNETLCFSDLNDRANALAHHLRQLGVDRETPVAVHLERSLDVPVAMLAVFKACGVYLPLDSSYPAARLEAMIREAGARVLITHSDFRSVLSADWTGTILVDTPYSLSTENLGIEVGATDLAYLMFTSGSTGKPKGVAVEHGQILNRLQWMWRTYPFDANDVSILKTSLNFVDSLWELLGPLLRGSPTVIAPESTVRDPQMLIRLLARHRVTRLWLVPSLLRALLEADDNLQDRIPRLRFWVTTGEALPTDLAELFGRRMPMARIYNLYGTTEVWDATWLDATNYVTGLRTVPIGQPIWNVRAYILGHDLRPLPAGAIGELYISGAGLARGYLERSQSALKFVADSVSGRPGARMYRTGDLASRLSSGDVVYHGRIDHQLKIRGVRVDPSDVELVLRTHPQLRDVVVTARHFPDSDEAKLIAHVTPVESAHPVEAELRDFARAHLPRQACPAYIVIMPALPLTPSGKIDRTALPVPQRQLDSAGIGRHFTPPEIEVLCSLCAEVLRLDAVGPHDDFFQLGGDSLLAMRLVARIAHALGVKLPVASIFEAPTVAELASLVVEPSPAGPEQSLVAGLATADSALTPSFAQRGMWLACQLYPDDTSWNVHLAARLDGPLDPVALRCALAEVVRRHEPLRATFELREGEPAVVVHEELSPTIEEVDLENYPSESREDIARSLVTAEIRRPFDLASGPVIRVLLIRCSERAHVAVLTAHHIACDGWSMETLCAELAENYRAHPAPPTSVAPRIRYTDYAAWQRTLLAGPARQTLTEYWRDTLADAPSLLRLSPAPRPERRRGHGAVAERMLAPQVGHSIERAGARAGATLFMTLTAGFAVVLAHRSGSDDLVVGTDFANRGHPELEQLVGLFVNQLPLRINLGANPTFEQLLRRVRSTTLAAYAHADLPFDQLVDVLRPRRSADHTPIFQTKIVLQNMPGHALSLPGVDVTPFPAQRDTAQLDLNLRAAKIPSGIILSAEYDTDLFDHSFVSSILADLELVLRRVCSALDTTKSALETMLDAEAGEFSEPRSFPSPGSGPRGVRRRSL